MASSMRVETNFPQKDDCYDNHGSPTNLISMPSSAADCCSTFELAVESTLQAIFAEQTAREMKEVMDYWKATVDTTPTRTLTTCSMPHNSLTVRIAEEEEDDEAGAITIQHDDEDEERDDHDEEESGHDHDDHNDAVASSYSVLAEQRPPAPQRRMHPPRNVLFSRECEISTSSNLSCVTNLLLLPEDEDDYHSSAEFSFSLHSRKGGKQRRCDNTSTATASTHMMNRTYSCDTSTASKSCTSSASSCQHHHLASFPPLSTTTTATCIYAADFWSNENHSIQNTGQGYPPVILLPPPLLVANQCNTASGGASSPCCSSFVVEHFHWTACQQQTHVNLACSRAQWMADTLAALVNNNRDQRSNPAAATSCNRDASMQQPLSLLRRLWKRVCLRLRRACDLLATEFYIVFCRALPLEYFRLWVYLWRLRHSYLLSKKAADGNSNNTNTVGTRLNHNFAKKTLKRDLIVTSLFMLVVAARSQLRSSSLLRSQYVVGDTATSPCLVCFQRDDTISSQPPIDPAISLPLRALGFETAVRYSPALSSSFSGQDDLLRL